jgi:hypothetical protein
MLNKQKPEDLKLKNEINAVLDNMSTYGVDSPEYPRFIEHLNALNELKQNQKSARRVSPDQMALILGNLAGVIIIVGYEHLHVVTSKALSLLVKAK